MKTPVARLNELCHMDRQTVRPEDPIASQLPFVGVENVGAGTGIINFDTDSRVGSQKSTTFRFDERHVLYAKLRPYLNKVSTPEFAGRCSTELVPLLPRDGVERDFIAHLLRRKETIRFVMATVTGSRMPRTDMKVLMSMRVPLPPLDEQRQIVGILNRAEKIEGLRNQAADLLREFITALFIKMFGDPVENPMGWEVEQLGKLIAEGLQNGLYKPKSEYGLGTRILRIDNFYRGYVTDPAGWKRVRLDNATVKKYALSEGDIVVNRVNSRPFLGKSAVIPKILESAVFESNMMRMRVDSNRVLPKFLISMLQIGSIRQQLCLNAKDAINQSSINQTDVCELSVIVPPLGYQHGYTQIVEKVHSTVTVAEKGFRSSSALTISLTARLLGDSV